MLAKDIRYAGQREYCFTIGTEEKLVEGYADLTVSKAMFDALEEQAGASIRAEDSSPSGTDSEPTVPRAPEA